jgi:hypothetical protein
MLVFFALCGPAMAQPGTANDATVALRALLAASGQVIPPRSSCYGRYGQRGAATVKDLLAVQLGNQATGSNAIRGGCVGSSCTLSITHDGGSDDVSSAEIRFSVRNGQARMATLTCIITP